MFKNKKAPFHRTQGSIRLLGGLLNFLVSGQLVSLATKLIVVIVLPVI